MNWIISNLVWLIICAVVAGVIVNKSKLKNWPWMPIIIILCWFFLGVLLEIAFKIAILALIVGGVIAIVMHWKEIVRYFDLNNHMRN